MQEIDKKLADKIWTEIEKANRILLHAHPNPDGDSLGSTLATRFALESKGKKVTLIKGDSVLPKYLSTLPGFSAITPKNFFEVDLKEVDLFLVLDSGSPDRVSKIAQVAFPLVIPSVVIDHHITNPKFGDINLVDSSYPATAQIMYDLFKIWGITITQDMALCLFVGIYTDTGGFVYRQTSSKTLHIASELADIAPQFGDLLFTLNNSNTKGQLKLRGLLLNSIETFFGDTVAIASISYKELQNNGINSEDAGAVDVANELKSVIQWNIGIRLMEDEPNIVKLSFRSRDPDKYDVSAIAKKLNGGGHKGASGARIMDSLPHAKERLLNAILEVYPELKRP